MILCIARAQKASHEEQIAIIGQQRLRRPIAPHLSVYNKKQTWFGTSAWMRVTGLAVGGVAYTYFAAYAAGSLFGWHFESQSVVGAFAALAPGTKSVIKFGLAFPFTFHFFNGIKQLMYDMVIGFGRRNIDRGQAIVWASGFVGALLLTFGL